MKLRRGWRWGIAAGVIALAALSLWYASESREVPRDEPAAARRSPQHHEDRTNAAARERPPRDRTSRP